MSGRIGECVAKKHERRREAIADIFESEQDSLYMAWLDAFGEESIRVDDRPETIPSAEA